MIRSSKKLAFILVIAMMFTLLIPVNVSAVVDEIQFAPENLTINRAIGVISAGTLAGTVTAPGAAAPITYSIKAGSGDTQFNIAATTGAITLKTALASGSYPITVSVNDDDLAAKEKSFTIVIKEPADGAIIGESTVEDVVLSVQLPTNLNFAVNPFEIGTPKGQITPKDYEIINNGATAVEVAFQIDMSASTAKFVTDKEMELFPNDSDAKDKDLYFAVLGAKSGTTGAYTFETGYGAASPAFDTEVGVGTDKKANIAFVLSDSSVTASNKTAFQFVGTLNTYAPWTNTDLKITGNYVITPLTEDTYDAEVLVQVSPSLGMKDPDVAAANLLAVETAVQALDDGSNEVASVTVMNTAIDTATPAELIAAVKGAIVTTINDGTVTVMVSLKTPAAAYDGTEEDVLFNVLLKKGSAKEVVEVKLLVMALDSTTP